MGGWSAVLPGRRRSERQVSDRRILGDKVFVKQVISGLDDLVKKNLRLSGRRIDIKTLAEKVSEKYNVPHITIKVVLDEKFLILYGRRSYGKATEL